MANELLSHLTKKHNEHQIGNKRLIQRLFALGTPHVAKKFTKHVYDVAPDPKPDRMAVHTYKDTAFILSADHDGRIELSISSMVAGRGSKPNLLQISHVYSLLKLKPSNFISTQELDSGVWFVVVRKGRAN